MSKELGELDKLLAETHGLFLEMNTFRTIHKAQVNVLRKLRERITGESVSYMPYPPEEVASG